jgi:hypothetical protein
MICEAARPTAGDPSSCHRLLLLLMYLCLLVECRLHDGAGRLAPRAVLLALPLQFMAVSRGSRPTLHAGDWQRCWSTLRRSVESDAARHREVKQRFRTRPDLARPGQVTGALGCGAKESAARSSSGTGIFATTPPAGGHSTNHVRASRNVTR